MQILRRRNQNLPLVSSPGVLLPLYIFVLFRNDAAMIFGRLKLFLLKNRVMILLLVLLVSGGISLYKGILTVK